MSHISRVCVVSYEWKECGSVLFHPADNISVRRSDVGRVKSVFCRWLLRTLKKQPSFGRWWLCSPPPSFFFVHRLGPRCLRPLHTRGWICKRLNDGTHRAPVGASRALQQGDGNSPPRWNIYFWFWIGFLLYWLSSLFVCVSPDVLHLRGPGQGEQSSHRSLHDLQQTWLQTGLPRHMVRRAHMTPPSQWQRHSLFLYVCRPSLGLAVENWVLRVKSNLNQCPTAKTWELL